MSENANTSKILVSQCFLSVCSACESGRGLWDSDGDRLNYCGNCGAKLDWTTVVDADADDVEREPCDGELDPPNEPAAPRMADCEKGEKPPLGIPPLKIFIQWRTIDILEAMLRYAKKGIRIPVPWRDELDLHLYNYAAWDDLKQPDKPDKPDKPGEVSR